MAKINTLVYDFATGVTGWTNFVWTGAEDQRASMVATNDYPTALNGGHDCIDSSLFARVWPAGGGGSGYTNTLLRLRVDSSNFCAIAVTNGQIRLHVRDAGVDAYAGDRAYDPATDAWLKIADTGNATITASTSSDGVTWTVLGSLPHAWTGADLSVGFQAGRSTSVADSTLYVDNINVPPSGPVARIRVGTAWQQRTVSLRAGSAWSTAVVVDPSNPAGDLLFDSSFETAASIMSVYPDENPETAVEGDDFGLGADPDTTKTRTVAWFDSWQLKHTGNNSPRASVNTGFIIKPAYHGNTQDEYWIGLSSYLPSSSKLTADGQWMSYVTAGFGPPYSGGSPGRITVQPRFVGGTYTGENIWQFNGRLSAFGTGANVVVPLDTWVYHLLHYKFAYDGWVEVFQHIDGAPDTTWQRLPIDGYTTGPAPVAPLAAGVNDAWVNDPTANACYTGIGVYGSEARRRYFAHHRVGRSKAAIDGPGNGWWIAPLPA